MVSPDVLALASGHGNFEGLIGQLQTADNDQRKAAEAVYEELWKEQPDGCVQQLVQCMRTSPQEESRQLTAVLLRKVLTKDGFWESLSPAMQSVVKTQLLAGLKEEPLPTVVKRICDAISGLAGAIYEDPGWPELLPFLFQAVSSNSPSLMASALSIFADLTMYLTEALKPQLPTLIQMLNQCLGHSSPEVQLAAVRAVAGFIESLEEPAERDKFQHMIPAMLAVLGATLNSGDEPSAQELLGMFITVAEAHPRFMRRQLLDVVTAMLAVAQAAQLEDSTRTLAAEFLVTLCEARDKAPGMMRKVPNFTGKLFETLMLFLLDVEDEPEWHSADDETHEDEGSGELYEFGQECLDRVSISLGGNSIVPAAAAIMQPWLRDADWKKRHATLICLAQIAEGCSKVMSTQLDVLVGMCLTGLADQHPKVRWASCQALGQMCTDLGPEIQNTQHAKILPALMSLMDDFSHPRVQAHASAAVVNFSESVDPEHLPPYLDTLITKLLVLLQHGKKMVQEGALTAMASVADSSQSLFVKYYDTVMPLLTTILTGATEKSHRMLRAKALECISLVGMAVGRDRFRDDARKVMTFLQQLQQTEMEADDPTIGYMLQAGARLCKCLGQEFIPYLSIVMPSLLKSAQLEPDIKVREADDDADQDDEDDLDVETIPLGDKTLTIRTSTLEEKATACNMLCCYADELKEGFLPWVKTVADIMIPLLRFWFHEEVRRAACQTLPELLRSCVLGVEKGVAGVDNTVVSQLLEFMWGPLMEALGKEPDTGVTAVLLDSVTEIVEMVEPQMLKQEQVQAAFEKFAKVLKAAEERRVERLKRQGTEDFDEEELEALEVENEAEEELFDQVGSCIGAFLKAFGDAVLPYVEEVMGLIAPLLAPSRGIEERRIAICVVDDMLEHSPAGREKHFAQLFPVLLDAMTVEQGDVRQCAVYGLGILAAKSPALFRPRVNEVLPRLVAIIRAPDARTEDREMAHDNAVSALGKILEHHAEVLDVASVSAVWLGALPLRGDPVEAQAMHELLVRLLEANDVRAVGPNGSHMPQVASVMVQVLGSGTVLVAGDVGLRMAQLLHRTQPSVPAEAVNVPLAALTPKQQVNFNTFMSGQVPTPASGVDSS